MIRPDGWNLGDKLRDGRTRGNSYYTVGYTNSDTYKCLEDLEIESTDLCIEYCGWEKCDPGHRFGPNRRRVFLLHVVEAGKGVYEAGGKKYELSAGDAFLIAPDQEAWYEADREEPWTYFWIGFTGYRAEECAVNSGFSKRSLVRHVNCAERLKRYVEGMLETREITFANEFRRRSYLLMFFAELMEDYQKSQPEFVQRYLYSSSVYVRRAMDYISLHYSEKIRIADLADEIGVNRSYLTRSFQNSIGCSPKEYLVNIRMEKARSFLRKTNMPVGAIANAVGYDDQLAFSKVFKQRCGMSPKHYREMKLVVQNKKGKYANNSDRMD